MVAKKQERKKSPYLQANCLSKLFFWWLNELIGLGIKRELTLPDLYEAHPEDQSTYLGDLLAVQWAKECERSRREEAEIRENIKKGIKGGKTEAKTPSLYRAIRTVFGKSFMLVGIIAFIEDCVLRIGQPVALGLLIRFFETRDDFPYYFGYILGAIIVVIAGLCTVTHHPYFFGVIHIGMQIRIAACSLIYRKATRLSQASLEQTAIGQMVNLLSNDVSRMDLIYFIHYIWIGPVQLTMITAMLWYYFGPLCFLGMGILTIYVPCQALVGRGFSKLREKTAIRTDGRIRVTNEILAEIRVIKMYCWEKLFQESIGNARKEEVKLIRRVSYLRTLNTTLYYISSKAIVFLTLLLHIVVFDGKLNAELVFVTLTLFNNVRLAMTLFFPNAVSQLAEVRVTMRRLNNFLLLDERKVDDTTSTNIKRKNGESQTSTSDFQPVRIKEVTAKWDPDDEENTIEDISLTLSMGKLTVVIGEVGSGKTSLLHVILKELRVSDGSVDVEGKIAYAAQEPWLFSGSVKQNILFGRPYSQEWYDQVTEACALTTDLQILPQGDETFVGERGCMLSGGQKARVTLARAVYADADIVILDDPLSAVDASVGQHLFSQCINGILSKKARILVTHQLQFVPFADYIIILQDGKIKAEGTYQKLITKEGINFQQLGEDFKAKMVKKTFEEPKPANVLSSLSFISTKMSRVSNKSKSKSKSRMIHQRSRAPSLATQSSKMDPEELRGVAQTFAQAETETKPGKETGGFLLGPGQSMAASMKSALTPMLMEAVVHQNENNKKIAPSTNEKEAEGKGDEPLAVLEAPPPALVHPEEVTARVDAAMAAQDETNGGEPGGGDGRGSCLLCFKYFHTGSSCCVILLFVLVNLMCQVLYTGSDYWLTIWTQAEETRGNNQARKMTTTAITTTANPSLTYNSSSSYPKPFPDWKDDPLYYVYHDRQTQIYGFTVISVIFFAVSATRTLQFFRMCMSSSIALHRRMLQGIVRSPMTFFESNPTGRILNRFSKDMGQVDDEVPITFYDAIAILLNVFGILVVVGVVNPYLIIPAVVLCIVFFLLRRIYAPVARSLKGLEGIARSPVFSHMSNSLYGLTTIRAFRAEADFIKQFDAHQDLHTSAWYLFIAHSRWFEVWLDWISCIYVGVVIFTFLLIADNAAEVGLAVSSAMMLTGSVQWGMRQSAHIQNLMVSVQRILDYSNLPSEAALESTDDKRPPANWPSRGELKFQHLFLSYGENSSPVLKDINCTIHPSEKIGIVGRTGAGKSTLISVLFRIAEPTGKLLIDDIDITEIGLEDLRSKISIIPQEPALFSATLRKNLDPFDKYSDEEIWRALEDCHLAKQVRTSSSGLNYTVAENGGNLSVGQRQLVSLARACLKRSKILILDEATANVDLETDHLIQNTIRTNFKDCTVLIVAHRLHTVMDCDRIMVLDAGRILEFNEPHELLKNNEGALWKLVEQTGPNTSKELARQAKLAHDERLESAFRAPVAIRPP